MSETEDGPGRWSSDLVGVGIWTLLASVAVFAVADAGPVSSALAFPLLVFLPGYALVSVLFPAKPVVDFGDERYSLGGRIGWVGRLAIAIAASPVLVAGVGFLLSSTVGISRVPTAIGVGTVTLLLVGLALVRRNRLPADQRVAPMAGFGTVVGGLLGANRLQQGLTIAALLVFVFAVGFVGMVPADGDSYTEAALLTENETGDLVATGFESTYAAGEDAPHRVAIWNHEGVSTTYGVVTVVESVDANGSVTARQQVDQTTATVDDGDRVVLNRTVSPSMTGEALRLRTYVYRGGIPDEPEPSGAAYSVHRWITVQEGDDAA